MRSSRYPKMTPRDLVPSKRRLAAARAALQRERDRAPLFAAEIAAEQPTPEERIARLDANAMDWHLDHRRWIAARWRRARAILAALEPALAAELRAKWQRSVGPACPSYLLDMIRTELRAQWGTETADDWLNQFAQERKVSDAGD